MNDVFLIAIVVVLVVVAALLAMILVRVIGLARGRDEGARDAAELRGRFDALARGVADHERDVRNDLAVARNDATSASAALRQ
ncbi:MAG TPA: hypothetical protein VGL43_00380, partial [Casimicrobiaceae bacterium]